MDSCSESTVVWENVILPNKPPLATARITQALNADVPDDFARADDFYGEYRLVRA